MGRLPLVWLVVLLLAGSGSGVRSFAESRFVGRVGDLEIYEEMVQDARVISTKDSIFDRQVELVDSVLFSDELAANNLGSAIHVEVEKRLWGIIEDLRSSGRFDTSSARERGRLLSRLGVWDDPSRGFLVLVREALTAKYLRSERASLLRKLRESFGVRYLIRRPLGPRCEALGSPVEVAPGFGDVGAPIRLTVFYDYECPFCARADSVVQVLASEDPGMVRLELIHFPLPFHENAFPAHEAAIFAEERGVFWQFHDRLMGHRGMLDQGVVWDVIEESGIASQGYEEVRDKGELSDALSVHMAIGHACDVRATPTVFVNGRRVRGEITVGVLRASMARAVEGDGPGLLATSRRLDTLAVSAKGTVSTSDLPMEEVCEHDHMVYREIVRATSQFAEAYAVGAAAEARGVSVDSLYRSLVPVGAGREETVQRREELLARAKRNPRLRVLEGTALLREVLHSLGEEGSATEDSISLIARLDGRIARRVRASEIRAGLGEVRRGLATQLGFVLDIEEPECGSF